MAEAGQWSIKGKVRGDIIVSNEKGDVNVVEDGGQIDGCVVQYPNISCSSSLNQKQIQPRTIPVQERLSEKKQQPVIKEPVQQQGKIIHRPLPEQPTPKKQLPIKTQENKKIGWEIKGKIGNKVMLALDSSEDVTMVEDGSFFEGCKVQYPDLICSNKGDVKPATNKKESPVKNNTIDVQKKENTIREDRETHDLFLEINNLKAIKNRYEQFIKILADVQRDEKKIRTREMGEIVAITGNVQGLMLIRVSSSFNQVASGFFGPDALVTAEAGGQTYYMVDKGIVEFR